jgi:hypothetical protein
VFSADYLSGAPPDLEARRPCANPVVIVPRNSEVTQIRRVILQASLYGALPMVDVDCFRVVEYGRLSPVRVEAQGHKLIMYWAEWSKVIIILISHVGWILHLQLEECNAGGR